MRILGISCYYHDAAAALVVDGRIVAAAQEERFTRKKHDPSFPENAIVFCLKQGGLSAAELDRVVFYDKPFLKFERLLESYLAFAPKGIRSALEAIPIWIKEKLWIREDIRRRLGYEGELLFPEHHESHAASAFFPSPFHEAAILTMDGVGEWATSTMGFGRGNCIELTHETAFPHSIGLLYSAFTYYTGFRVNSGEYKLMGLAPYGNPIHADRIREHLIDIKEDGSFRLNMAHFDFATGLTMTNTSFDRVFGGPPRKPETPIGQREMDLAASVQVITEEVVLKAARHLRRETGMANCVLAGGVALNCVANGKILREGIFDRVWVQPASGDAGGALGAALFAWHQLEGGHRPQTGTDRMQGALLGPAFADTEADFGVSVTYPDTELFAAVAAELEAGHVVGWFQGRMEFGPRALGARSILGDPRNPDMQRRLNVSIKFRESFRPFAPSVLAEHSTEWFELKGESPYMLLTAPVARDKRLPVDSSVTGFDQLYQIRSGLPAITHVDGSARVQTVTEAANPRYHRLLAEWHARTGCPVLINTSFNVRGEPIVCTPTDAWRCFLRTHMDVLVIGNRVWRKADQTESEVTDTWREEFPLD